jgi:hypothetical protein
VGKIGGNVLNTALTAGVRVLLCGLLARGPLALAATNEAALQQYTAVVDRYCLSCHDSVEARGGLALDDVDLGLAHDNAAIMEKMLVKLRGRAMPPAGKPRPEAAVYDGFVAWMETQLDAAASATPDPGRAPAHRLNRSEYQNAIRDLLGIQVDAALLLPPDDESFGFDNNANTLSPALLDSYLSAAWEVSRVAVGSAELRAETSTYRVRPDASQWERMPGLPLGTYGGMTFDHTFPLDAEYEFRVRLWRTPFDTIRGLEKVHEVEVAVDGERVFVGQFGGEADYATAAESTRVAADRIDDRLRVQVPVKSGLHTVTVAFLQKSSAVVSDHLQPYERTNQDILNYYGRPHLDRVTVGGPFQGSSAGVSASRARIFVCTPDAARVEETCARRIIGTLARRAYRRPVDETDMQALLGQYRNGREKGTFEAGITVALRAILANPEFVFRWEQDPASLAAGAIYTLSDLQLASRLSLFLWSSIPDEELLEVAAKGRLSSPAVLEKQVRRMLADPRAAALVGNFAGQWLFLRNLRSMAPDSLLFPDWDDNLRESFKRETELFFGSIVQENRSILDVIGADDTFVNDRLARHYGIPGVVGNEFRRIRLTDSARFGILGKGSTLVTTVYPTRTSPVLRGKWILTQLLGMPPPPPPPNVPQLKENSEDGQAMTVRQRLELHRADPACASCHAVMDPLGFALENFDAVGSWRVKGEDGLAIDASGQLASGQAVDGVDALRKALLEQPAQFADTFTRQLLTYALGRGLEASDMPVVRHIVRDARPEQYRFSDIVLGIVRSVPFRMKRKEPEATSLQTSTAPTESQRR